MTEDESKKWDRWISRTIDWCAYAILVFVVYITARKFL